MLWEKNRESSELWWPMWVQWLVLQTCDGPRRSGKLSHLEYSTVLQFSVVQASSCVIFTNRNNKALSIFCLHFGQYRGNVFISATSLILSCVFLPLFSLTVRAIYAASSADNRADKRYTTVLARPLSMTVYLQKGVLQ